MPRMLGLLSLVILYYWVVLIENSTDLLGVLLDLGNGLEIRTSLLIKVSFLFINMGVAIIKPNLFYIPKPLLIFSLFLFSSTLSVYWISPQYFISALSVNFHIQLMLNMMIFIKTQIKDLDQLKVFYNHILTFGFINAILVIISYFFNNLIPYFEAGTGYSDVTRAFGLMGDEVSVFLTFFFYEALVNKRYLKFGIYLFAILCTGGVGAFIVTIFLLVYYGLVEIKLKMKYKLGFFISLMSIFFLMISFSSSVREINVIKRIENNIKNPDQETGRLRFLSLSISSEMIQNRPILGYGYGSYQKNVYGIYAPKLKKAGYGWIVPGSMVILGSSFNPYIQMVCESGIIGLVIFLYFLHWIYQLYNRNVKNYYRSFSINEISRAHLGWFLVFCFTVQSANWLLPASFNLLLIVILTGIHLRLNELVNE